MAVQYRNEMQAGPSYQKRSTMPLDFNVQAMYPTDPVQKVMEYPRLSMFKHEEVDSLNFKKWLLSLTAIANLILAPLMIFMGIEAAEYKVEGIMIADEALIALGITIVLFSIVTLFGVAKESTKIHLMMFYMSILSIIFMSVFGIGALTFRENFLNWVDDHWPEIRVKAKDFDMAEFKAHVASELVSLGGLALTVTLSLFLGALCIVQILGVDTIIRSLFPLFNLLLLDFSMALVMVALYIYQQTALLSILPASWTILLVTLGVLLLILALLGYHSYSRKSKGLFTVYILLLGVYCGLTLTLGILFMFLSYNLTETLADQWPNIQGSLRDKGYEVLESTLISFIQMQLRFGALFVLIIACFLGVGLPPAIYVRKIMHTSQLHYSPRPST